MVRSRVQHTIDLGLARLQFAIFLEAIPAAVARVLSFAFPRSNPAFESCY